MKPNAVSIHNLANVESQSWQSPTGKFNREDAVQSSD